MTKHLRMILLDDDEISIEVLIVLFVWNYLLAFCYKLGKIIMLYTVLYYGFIHYYTELYINYGY